LVNKNLDLDPDPRSGFTEKTGSGFNEDGSGTVEETFTDLYVVFVLAILRGCSVKCRETRYRYSADVRTEYVPVIQVSNINRFTHNFTPPMVHPSIVHQLI
jgi:hypothetical protein